MASDDVVQQEGDEPSTVFLFQVGAVAVFGAGSDLQSEEQKRLALRQRRREQAAALAS